MCKRGIDCAYTVHLGATICVNVWVEESGTADVSDRLEKDSPLWNDLFNPTLGIHFSQPSGGFLTRNRPIDGSKFVSQSQLVYGPCMSSLTAAVFTSR